MDIADRSFWRRRVRLLAYFTIAYNVIEGAISIYFGTSDDSVSLFGFGVDSFIEAASALVVLWRFRKEEDASGTSGDEMRANQTIGALFYALAGITTLGAVLQLSRHGHPETTFPGVIIAAASLSFMFALYFAKMKAGKALGSSVVVNDAKCSLACIKLSVVLFLGSLVYYVAPALWWADSVAALGISWFIFREGQEMRAEEGCGECC